VKSVSYTLATAAEAARVTKPTVFRWIKKGKISATKAEDGTYRIEPAELHRYLDSVAQETSPPDTMQEAAIPSEAPADVLPELITLRCEVEKLQALLATERQRAEEWKTQADKWAAQAERLALPSPAPTPSQPRGWWPFRRAS
jgi:excisionase family DNA binding protein